LAIDLTTGSFPCPVTYYASEDALPWGKIWTNPVYKGDVLLMRKIKASHVLSFMGSPETEANRIAGRETRRMCTLTNDFYMAIFPTTCRHHYLLTDAASTETRLIPIFYQSYNMLRYTSDNKTNAALPINFPTTSRTRIGSSSILQTFRDHTGLVLDLPTSAQWEYACRAGMDTPLNWGDGSMERLGIICQLGGACRYEVGTKGSNNWQLFDMIGNIYEWCLDYGEDDITAEAVTDPLGPLSHAQVQRKIRGLHGNDIHKRCAFFTWSGHTTQQENIGYRLCIPLP